MSELKAYTFSAMERIGLADYYLKSEADKVIAELKETLNNSRNARKYWRKEYLIEYKECSHQKYKRCLAMAKWCAAECVVNKNTYKSFLTRKSEFRIGHFRKWYLRWLELAEEFKPNTTINRKGGTNALQR